VEIDLHLLPCTLATVLCVTCSTASSTTSVAMLRGVEPKAVEKQRSQYHVLDTSAVQQRYQMSVFTCNPTANCVRFFLNHTLLIREV
jgi:hypothetical protein